MSTKKPYALVEYSGGGCETSGYLSEPGRIEVYSQHDSEPFVVVHVPNSGARREGLRLEMDIATASEVSRKLSRELTEHRKRAKVVQP
jgi:hypothetical protein